MPVQDSVKLVRVAMVVVVGLAGQQQGAAVVDIVGDGLLLGFGVDVLTTFTRVGDDQQHGVGQVGGGDTVSILDPVEAMRHQVVLELGAVS